MLHTVNPARLIPLIAREFRAEGITGYALFGAGELHVTRIAVKILHEQRDAAQALLNELGCNEIVYVEGWDAAQYSEWANAGNNLKNNVRSL